MEFELHGSDYIELNSLMKIAGMVGTGGEANIHITGGEVLVNGQVETQKRKKIRSGDRVSFLDHSIVVK